MHSILLYNFPGILCTRHDAAPHALETDELQQNGFLNRVSQRRNKMAYRSYAEISHVDIHQNLKSILCYSLQEKFIYVLM
jgi:hypothetical protein